MPVYKLNYGPQHPGTHPFRLLLTIDGDTVIDAEPHIGYVHRGIEKLCEYRTYIMNIPVINRACFMEGSFHEHAYAMAVEQIFNIEIPERAKYLRVLAAELSRIHSLLSWFGGYVSELGFSTMYFWPWADREYVLDLFEELTGARISTTYILPGGVRWDIPDGFEKRVEKVLRYLERRLELYEKVVFKNEIFKARTVGVGILKPSDVIKYGVTGPMARASGVKMDLRLDDPYSVYDEFEFDYNILEDGDCYARTKIRLMDIKQSIDIIRQIFPKLPDGPVVKKLPVKAPVGEGYARVESARGIHGYYVVSDGGKNPYRVKIRGASFNNMSAISVIAKNVKLADIPAVLGSIDVCPADLDR
ncbi:MAG: NADH-quinone oxidoreductase subunit D [Candidatus Asgardarchaeia archaeon]